MKKLTSSGQEPEENPKPENPGPEQSAEQQCEGIRKGPWHHFSSSFAGGVGQALGVAFGGLLLAISGFAASEVAAEMQNGPNQSGRAAVSCTV
ncbi:hypothetical protein [Streptomyces sp. bgisy126]|uniref:hypothetical protein n=1 Tax=unclassified Streptomyces TaxID=2593676 RepID=UPI003EBC6F2C